jgi:hypothetical protein
VDVWAAGIEDRPGALLKYFMHSLPKRNISTFTYLLMVFTITVIPFAPLEILLFAGMLRFSWFCSIIITSYSCAACLLKHL